MSGGITISEINAMNVPQLRKVISDNNMAGPTRVHAFGELLEKAGDKIWSTLPKHVTKDRLQGLALKTIRREPKLLDCSVESIFTALADAASLGLEIDGQLGHAYLIPYKTEAKMVLGYRGLLDLARRFDKINIYTACVHEGDEFYFQFGDDPMIKHVPRQDDTYLADEKITHVYLVAKDAGGSVICRSVWSRKTIEAHKEKFSPGWRKSDSPWQKAWSTMARKTLIRDSINRGEIPVSSEIMRLALEEEHIEAIEVQGATVETVRPNTIAALNEPKATQKPEEQKPQSAGRKGKPKHPANVIAPGEMEEPEQWIQRLYDGFLCGEYSKAQCVDVVREQAGAGFVGEEEVGRFEALVE